MAFEDREWTIGFSNASETNTWRTALRESIEEEVARHDNVSLLITDANDSPAKQVSDMEDLLTKGVDGLIIGAANLYVANPILDECEREGIPVVIVDRKVSSDKYDTFVSTDHMYGARQGPDGAPEPDRRGRQDRHHRGASGSWSGCREKRGLRRCPRRASERRGHTAGGRLVPGQRTAGHGEHHHGPPRLRRHSL